MSTQKIKTFLTFNGNAEEAMKFYAENLPNAKITKFVPYGKDHPHASESDENRVLMGVLLLMGQEIWFLDMATAYPAPEFNWAMSILIACSDEAEFDIIFNALSNDGIVIMGPEPAAHFRKCAWVTDKFGITWQPVWE